MLGSSVTTKKKLRLSQGTAGVFCVKFFRILCARRVSRRFVEYRFVILSKIGE